MSIQEMIDRGDVTVDELHEMLTAPAQTNHADDTVLDDAMTRGEVVRMIQNESRDLERFLLIRIDDMERRLGKIMTTLESMQTF